MIRKAIITIILFMSANLNAQYFLNGIKINLDWELAYNLPGRGSVKKTNAIVPGAVQLDIANAENYNPWYYDENWKDYLWMEDQFFTYLSKFERPELAPGEKIYFYSGGIDYKFDIMLNGKLLLQQEGMFTPVELDITPHLRDKNELEVVIHPVPKKHDEPADRSQAAASLKPAVSYSWDWHPRLIPSGIWKETYLHKRPASFLDQTDVGYSLSEDLEQATIELTISGTKLRGNQLIWKIRNMEEQVVASKVLQPKGNELTLNLPLANPVLWWPHDQGNPYLYESVVELRNSDNELIQLITRKIGFRKVRLVMNEGAWSEPQGFPKSRSVAPAQLEINGRKIFAKGTNWVNPDIFPGTISPDRYNELTDRAVEANFNMLRVWGGGIVNKDAFYQQCDEKGLLVWQEFPLACNNYVGTPEFLEVLEQESASIITSLRHHPCIAIWSGGNELFNSWSGMTDQSLALRMLNSQCLKYDPGTPYINTSPLMGMGHGHYVFRDMQSGEEVYSIMERAHFTAYTEFGMPGPSSVEILESIIPDDQLWPPKPGTAWESHHAFNAWVGDTWLMQEMIEDYFGPSGSIEELVANGQLIQAEGYKAIYEEARRQKPYCSMALNWCFNEPWPTAANNSLINWPNEPKPGFYAVRDACRPVLASARIKKFKWKEGETFETDIFLLNDLYEEIPPGEITIKLVTDREEQVILKWDHPGASENTNIEGPTARAILPRWDTDRFQLVLESKDHPAYNSAYTLLYRKNRTKRDKTATLNQ